MYCMVEGVWICHNTILIFLRTELTNYRIFIRSTAEHMRDRLLSILSESGRSVHAMSENLEQGAAEMQMNVAFVVDTPGKDDATHDATIRVAPLFNDTSLKKEASIAPEGDAAGAEGGRPWDFSNRRVLVQGVVKFHDVKRVTKEVNKWMEEINAERTDAPLAFDKIKKPPNGGWMVVTMQTEAMVLPFIDFINGTGIITKRGNKMLAKLAVDDSGGDERDAVGKRSAREDDDNDGQPSKRQRKAIDGDEVQNARRPITEEEIKYKITPLWKLSPQEQLDTKMKQMIKKCAMKIMNEIKTKFR